MFETLIEKIEAHPTYGPAIQQAATEQWSLVLDYHNHGDPSAWCVAICTKQDNLIPLLGGPEKLQELAHIRGLGRAEFECLSLMAPLGEELRAHYTLEQNPVIYLNGAPFESS